MKKQLLALVVLPLSVIQTFSQEQKYYSSSNVYQQARYETFHVQPAFQSMHVLMSIGKGGFQFRNLFQPPKIEPNTSATFTVHFNNNDSVIVKSKIETLVGGQSFITVGKGNKMKVIKPQDTKQIFYTNANEQIVGIPVEGTWLFKIYEGRINAFSQFPDKRKEFILFLQQGEEGNVVACEENTLLIMVRENLGAVELVKKGKWAAAIERFNQAQ